jgi:hypothetical protein
MQKPNAEQGSLLDRLKKEEVENALDCLYNMKKPELPVLQNLEVKEWALLIFLLESLMQERRLSKVN